MDDREYPDRLMIRVLTDEIANGEPCDCSTCPIAMAARRDYPHLLRSAKDPEFEVIEVYSDRLLIGDACYQLPAVATYFIGMFDRGEKVEPFSFNAWKIKRDRKPENPRKPENQKSS